MRLPWWLLPADRRHRAGALRPLLDMDGVPLRWHQPERAVSLAVLLADHLEDRPGQPGVLGARVPAALPRHLLLLPQGVLPILLLGSARHARSASCATASTAVRRHSRSSSTTCTASSSISCSSSPASSGTTSTSPSGRPNGHVQLGLGTGIMLVNVILLSGYTFGCHSWRHLVGGGLDCYSKSRLGQARYRAWQWVTVLNQRHPRLGVVQHVQRRHHRRVHPPACGPGSSSIRTSSSEMATPPEPYDTIECDVLVVGAGGAGMRAAIAAADAGCTVTVVTKSLLGKAHTVMAEGGIAAGMGNVDAEDSWEVHFADTMLGGQLLNNWRMVELYAHEVIDRVLELERWGGIFDRTAGRTHHAARVRRAFLEASRPRRRSHRPRAHPHVPGQDGAHRRASTSAWSTR